MYKKSRNREGRPSRFSFVWAVLALVAVLLAPSVASCAEEATTTAPLKIAVIKPLAGLAKAWANSGGFPAEVREFDLEAALRQVGGGAYDFALIRGDLSPGQETVLSKISGAPPDIETVAWEAITLIVHPDNSLPSMAAKDLPLLIGNQACLSATASLETWEEVGAEPPLAEDFVHLVLPGEKTPGGDLLQSKVLGMCPFKDGLLSYSSDAATEREVASHPAALGFIHCLRYIGQAKILPLQVEGEPVALTPNPESLRSGKYPLSQRIRFVASKRIYFPHPAAKFLQHAKSREGQLEVRRLGYFPIK